MLKSTAILATILLLAACGAGSPMRVESRTGATNGTSQAKLEAAAARNVIRARGGD